MNTKTALFFMIFLTTSFDYTMLSEEIEIPKKLVLHHLRQRIEEYRDINEIHLGLFLCQKCITKKDILTSQEAQKCFAQSFNFLSENEETKESIQKKYVQLLEVLDTEQYITIPLRTKAS